MTTVAKDPSTLEISVRSLAEHVYKRGDLSASAFSGISGAEGTRLHSRVFSDLKRQYESASVDTEHSFSSEYQAPGVSLLLRGRADCILSSENQGTTLLEIKSCTGDTLHLDSLFQEIHWAQVMLYACMFLRERPDQSGVFSALRYVSIETMDSVEKKEWIERDVAERYFIRTCEAYIDFARNFLAYQKKRNASILSLPFPYPVIRNGQKDFMRQVVQTIAHRSLLLASAPTGIGKTVSTLYPALKSLGNDRCGRIFYITAKAAARAVAEKAMQDMRNAGLFLRSITLRAKESLCLCPDIYCETKQCPYALGYFDRLSAGIDDLLLELEITPQRILTVAEKRTLCPHELTLDISLFCDVIIGDYNHALHPRVRLDRYFGQKETGYVLLIDEAHNLVDRSRDMFSASVKMSSLRGCQKHLLGMDSRVDGYMTDLLSYFQILSDSILRKEDGFSLVESSIERKSVLSADFFRGTRDIPKMLYAVLWKFCHFVRPLLDRLAAGDAKNIILAFFFDARFFLTVLELHYDTSYIFTAEVIDGNFEKGREIELTLTLECLDASSKIKNILLDQHSAVFFSATLSPTEYYQSMLLGNESEDKADTLMLPSPFPPENMSVYIVSDVKTTYKERLFSLDKISDFILKSVRKRTGNYLVYLPSFLYMKRLFSRVISTVEEEGIRDMDCLCQEENMSGKKKEDFLRRFESYGERTLLAFAVLGGHFGEGIDLVGERLNGVFIVGVGLPQISPRREIMRQYYQERFGDGFSFAYRFPGWEKVLQAAGRVIRDEGDTGFVVLMDERYDRPEYRSLFPEHWRPVFILQEDSMDD